MTRFSCIGALTLCLVLTGSAIAEPPSNGYIGVFGDADGTNCCITLNKSGNGKLWVYAVSGGASADGIQGAEFKITVEPPAPAASFNWTPAKGTNVSVGNPIDNGDGGGALVTFNDCQGGLVGDKILLGTIQAFNLDGEHRLVVRKHDAPLNATFQCPSVLMCDGPTFTQVCLTYKDGDPALGGEEPIAFVSAVNSADCAGTSCGFVSTEDETWSTVKALFR
ncbi:MAG: hypothetical protein JSW67_08225 [Candidatus Latescibacterota bacterium]|nr:MAG: hypothetical protein JSW67_08225 [Candidatus Latescibacterota bacterium]